VLDVEKRLSEIIHSAVFPVAILDREGRFLFANQVTATMLRQPSGELPGTLLRDILVTKQIDEFESRIHRVVDARETHTYEEEIELPDGPRWLASILSPIQLSGSDYGVLVVGIDISDERMRAERQLAHELARVDRVNSLGEMVTGVTHELSQPLSAVTNFIRAARNAIDLEDQPQLREAAEWLRQASSAANNASEIIRRLRSFSREQPIHRVEESVSELIAGAISLMRFEFQRHKMHVAWDNNADELRLLVDRVQIQQVLVNLLQNACEAMEACDVSERVVAVGVLIQDDYVEFFVRDRGIGLPENASQLFDRFVTTKPHGLGLGLAISKTIVEEHGGKLWAERNPDTGSTFRFILPIPGSS
jgi:two-component system sensor kinase FixL